MASTGGAGHSSQRRAARARGGYQDASRMLIELLRQISYRKKKRGRLCDARLDDWRCLALGQSGILEKVELATPRCRIVAVSSNQHRV